jgi:hypothetical protein
VTNHEFVLAFTRAGPSFALPMHMHILGSAREAIDQCYEEFVNELPEELRTTARHLPLLLGLSTRTGVSWIDAVEQPVLLSLPTLLLSQLSRPVSPELSASTQRAHLFAMISAVIHERLDDGSVEVDTRIDAILLAVERQRHRGLAELRLLGADRSTSFMGAEREARNAAASERDVFEGRSEAELPSYVAICCGKHSLAFPATMAAVVAAGAELEELAHVHDLILGVMLGVAARREVTERRERARAGRSWIVALTGEGDAAEVIGQLFELAGSSFERAATAAAVLGIGELGSWAQWQAEQVREQAEVEAKLGRARLRDRKVAA